MKWTGKASMVCTLILVAAFACFGQRNISADDLYDIKTASDPQLSPQADFVAYIVTEANAKRNGWHSAVWIVPIDGSKPPRRFTASGYSAKFARWSPDGRSIAFLASPEKEAKDNADSKSRKSQIYLQTLDENEGHSLTSFENGVSEFAWSPKGDKMVCVSASRQTAIARGNSDTRHYVHSTYKEDGSGFLDDRRRHLWLVSVVSREVAQITNGSDWDDTDPQWSPDARQIAFYSDRSGAYWEDVSNGMPELWTITADGKSLTKLSDHVAKVSPPQWSKDGEWIAHFTAEQSDGPRTLLLASPRAPGSTREILKDVDLSVHGLTWNGDDHFLYFITNERGEAHVMRADVSRHEFAEEVVRGPRFVRNLDVNGKSDRIVFTASDVKHPAELYAARLDGQDEKMLSHANDEFLRSVKLQDVNRLSYSSFDGVRVDAFLVKPTNWDPKKKYPMVLNIHGGPQGMYGMDWMFQIQLFAARGWAVLYINPRGSSGYGSSFTEAAVKEWGGGVYKDLMAGVDWVIGQDSWVDGNSLGVTGCSFGGYMTNWIVSQTTRFKAAVPMCSISNYISDEGTRDAYYGHTHDFGGDLYTNFDLYWKYSPIRYAANVKTPTLILHGESDQRVPLEQAEQWFRALHHFQVPSELVIFPRESHDGLLHGEPRHVVEVMQWQVYWFEKYLDHKSTASSPDVMATNAGTKKAMK